MYRHQFQCVRFRISVVSVGVILHFRSFTLPGRFLGCSQPSYYLKQLEVIRC